MIGSGASGCQIADELIEVGRRTFLSVGRHRRVPRHYRGHDVFWWRRGMGELDRTVDDLPARLRPMPPLVTGVNGGYDVDLRQSAARGLRLCGHLSGVSGTTLAWADDLEESLRAGDRHYHTFLSEVDDHVARTGLDAAPGPRADDIPGDCTPVASPGTLDLRAEGVGAVIWATCYSVYRADGSLIEESSTTPVNLALSLSDTVPEKFGPGASLTMSDLGVYCKDRRGAPASQRAGADASRKAGAAASREETKQAENVAVERPAAEGSR